MFSAFESITIAHEGIERTKRLFRVAIAVTALLLCGLGLLWTLVAAGAFVALVVFGASAELFPHRLAQLARVIGGPLPTGAETGVPMVVAVTEDAASGGQIWTRICARSNGFPQVIHSAKRFAGPTGLEEYVGYGVSMALRISVEHEALVFRSVGYSLQIGPLRVPLPPWLTPGDLTVTHSDLGGGTFRFSLDIVHPRFGKLIRQSAVFMEAAS